MCPQGKYEYRKKLIPQITRRMKLHLFLLLIPLSFQLQHACGQPLSEQIDALVTRKMEQYQIPGLAIGVVQGNSLTYSRGYGVKNIRSDEAVSDESIFHAASISKLSCCNQLHNGLCREQLANRGGVKNGFITDRFV